MIAITKLHDESNTYRFDRIDEADGTIWELGEATERTQYDGYTWHEGYFDTQAISFDSDEQCERIVAKNDGEIVWLDGMDELKEYADTYKEDTL